MINATLSELEEFRELVINGEFDVCRLTVIADQYTNEDLTFFRDCLDFMIICRRHK